MKLLFYWTVGESENGCGGSPIVIPTPLVLASPLSLTTLARMGNSMRVRPLFVHSELSMLTVLLGWKEYNVNCAGVSAQSTCVTQSFSRNNVLMSRDLQTLNSDCLVPKVLQDAVAKLWLRHNEPESTLIVFQWGKVWMTYCRTHRGIGWLVKFEASDTCFF